MRFFTEQRDIAIKPFACCLFFVVVLFNSAYDITCQASKVQKADKQTDKCELGEGWGIKMREFMLMFV